MVIPDGISLIDWSSSLVVDFPNDNISFLSKEDDWREWGDDLVQENSFSKNAAPDTRSFDDWQTWAYAVFKTMANF